MKKQLFLYISILIIFISCKKNTTPSATSDNTAIGMQVDELYKKYGKSNEAIYNEPISNNLFSKDLKSILEDAINASKTDIEKVKNSDHPDEKPLIFEGAIFSSLYEGYTNYKIEAITVKGKTAEALVQFEYDMASPKVIWKDKIELINMDKKWKVDNIVFDSIKSSRDLKTEMKGFIQNTHQ